MPRKRKTLADTPAQAVAVAPGGAYGSRQDAMAAQRAVPIAGTSTPSGTPTTPSPLDAALAHPAPTGMPLTAPSQRPNEPFTAGLDVGAGPGSESLVGIAGAGAASPNDTVGQTLRDLYARYPYPGIRELIADHSQ